MNAGDVLDIGRARISFQCTMLLPFICYHILGKLFGSRFPSVFDAEPKFPATISWSVRKKLPFHVFFLFWLDGWRRMGLVLSRRTDACSDALTMVFCMVCTGILAMAIAPVGIDAVHDKIHYGASFLYMLGHVFFILYFGIASIHSRLFTFFFILFILATLRLRHLKCLSRSSETLKLNYHRTIKRTLFLEMIFEYGLFFAFITGLDSGLPLST